MCFGVMNVFQKLYHRKMFDTATATVIEMLHPLNFILFRRKQYLMIAMILKFSHN